MNHIYRLKFNRSRQTLSVVSELTRGMVKGSGSNTSVRLGQLTKLAMAFLPLLGFSQFALAATLPSGASVVSGVANMQANAQSMVINQQTDKLITNWQSFDIGKTNSVEFKQPSASSVALNRVTAGPASQILGSLKANGQVYLINPKGILFGKDAQVNVGSLVATTGNINNADFLNNKIALTHIASGGIINQGNLKVNQAGYIVLAAPEIKNEGTISASNGKIALAAANKVTLHLDNQHLLSVDVGQDTLNALIDNKGLIAASNGQVYLTAKGARALGRDVINLSGTVDVTAIRQTQQGIFIDGGNSGVTRLSGSLLANGQQRGGKVVMTGQQLVVSGNIEATGGRGGSVYLGGGWQGKDPEIRNADKVTFTDKASINVAGKRAGGKAVLWSEKATIFAGKVDIGNNGALETSSRDWLSVTGKVEGSGGRWLLDPSVISISDASSPMGRSGMAPTTSDVTVDAIKASLDSGTSITIEGDIINANGLMYTYSNSGDMAPTLALTAKSILNISNSQIRSNVSANSPLSLTLTSKDINITNSVIDLRTSTGNGTFISNSDTFVATNSTLVAGKVNITATSKSVLAETITAGSDSWQKRNNTNAIWIKNSRIAANNGDLVINASITLPTGAKTDLINAGMHIEDSHKTSYPLFADAHFPGLKDGVADSTKITRNLIPSENAITIIDSILHSDTASVTINGTSGGEFSGVRLLGSRNGSTVSIPASSATAGLVPLYDFGTNPFEAGATSFNGVSIKAATNVSVYGESLGTSSLIEINGKYPSAGNGEPYLYSRFGERGSLYLEGNISINATKTSLLGNNKRSNNPLYYPTGFAFYNLNAKFDGKADIQGYADSGNGIVVWSKSKITFNTPAGMEKQPNYIHAISRRGSGLTFINFNYEGDYSKDNAKATTNRAEIVKENVFNLQLNNADFNIYAKGRENGFYSGFSNNAVGDDAIESLNINSNSVAISGTGNVDAVGIADRGFGFTIKALDNTKLRGFVNITGISETSVGVTFSPVPKKTDGEDKPVLKYNVTGHAADGCTTDCKDQYGINILGFSESSAGVEISASLTPDLPSSLALLKAKALLESATDDTRGAVMAEVQNLAAAHPDIAHFLPTVENSNNPAPLPVINITGVSKTHNGINIKRPTDGYPINLNGINLRGVSYSSDINNSGIAIHSPIQFVNSLLTGISRAGNGVTMSGGSADTPSMLIQSQLRGISGNQTGAFSGIDLSGHITLLRSKMLDAGAEIPVLQADYLTKAEAFSLDLTSYNKVTAEVDPVYSRFNTLNTGDTLSKDDAPAIPETEDDYYAGVRPKGINIQNAMIQGKAVIHSNHSEHISVGINLASSGISMAIPVLTGALDLSSVASYFTDTLLLMAQGKTGAVLGDKTTLSGVTLNASTADASGNDDAAVLLTGEVSLNDTMTINANNQKHTGDEKPVAIRIHNAKIKSTNPAAVTLTATGIQNILTIDDSILLEGIDTTSPDRLRIMGMIAGLTETELPAAKTSPLIRIGNATINNTDFTVDASVLTSPVTSDTAELTLFDLRPNKTTPANSGDKLTLVNSTINAKTNYLTGVSINNSIDFRQGSKIIVEATDSGSATTKLPPSLLIGNFRQSPQIINLTGETNVKSFNDDTDSADIQLIKDAWMLINLNALSALNIDKLAIIGKENNHIQKPSENGRLSITNSVLSNKVSSVKSTLDGRKITEPDTHIGMWLSNINLNKSRIVGKSSHKDITALVINRVANVIDSEITTELSRDIVPSAAPGVAALKINNDPGGLELVLSGSVIYALGPLYIKAEKGISLEKSTTTNEISQIYSESHTVIDAPNIVSRDTTSPPENKIIANFLYAPDDVKTAPSAMLTLTNSSGTLTLTGLNIAVNSSEAGFNYGLLLDKTTKIANGNITVNAGDDLAVQGMDKLQDGEGRPLLSNLLVTPSELDPDNKVTIANDRLVFNLTKPASGDFSDNYAALKAVKSEDITELPPVEIPPVTTGGDVTGSPADGDAPETPDVTPPLTPPAEDGTSGSDADAGTGTPGTDEGTTPEGTGTPGTAGVTPSTDDSRTENSDTTSAADDSTAGNSDTSTPQPPAVPDSSADDTTQPLLQPSQQQTIGAAANLAANSKQEFIRLSTPVETVQSQDISVEICDVADNCAVKQLDNSANNHVTSQP